MEIKYSCDKYFPTYVPIKPTSSNIKLIMPLVINSYNKQCSATEIAGWVTFVIIDGKLFYDDL